MTNTPKNILITGFPGSGKTTLVRKLAVELRDLDPAGFTTEEVRPHGTRKGFKLASLDGKKTGTLAHVEIKGIYKIGKYVVDLQGFEQFLAVLHLTDPAPRLVIIDEIGKMECLSPKFQMLVTALLDAPGPVVATIALKAGGFIDRVKHRADVEVLEVTEGNRDALPAELARRIRALPL